MAIPKVLTYETSSLFFGSVLCVIPFFRFFSSPRDSIFCTFFPIGEQIEMQEIEHNEIQEVEAHELPAPQPGQCSICILIFCCYIISLLVKYTMKWEFSELNWSNQNSKLLHNEYNV